MPMPGHGICRLPIDDQTSLTRGTWSPWAHPPHCITAENKTNKKKKKKKNRQQKLCAYVHDTFRGVGGLALLTTPVVASAATALLEDHDPRWLGLHHQQPPPPSGPPAYAVRAMPDGRGRGVVAVRDIAEGEVIMSDVPAFVRLLHMDRWGYGPVMAAMRDAGNKLPVPRRRRVMGMAASMGGEFLEDVFQTNSFQVTLGGVDHSALYPDIAVSLRLFSDLLVPVMI
jgi:hypothetical protein